MISKRQAVLLLFSGVISKMAHADDKGNVPNFWPSGTTVGDVRLLGTMKTGISLNLDSFTGVTVTMDGKEVTVTSADLFKALTS